MLTSTKVTNQGQTAKPTPIAGLKGDAPVLPGIAIDNLMIISFEGMGMFKSVLVGMEYGQYLIIKCPLMPDLPLKLYQQNYFIIRYIYGGSVFGFKTTLISLVREPVRLFILEYPRSVESLNLRKTQRFACQLPACVSIASDNSEPVKMSGFIVDISADGCCLECQGSEELKSLNAKIGTPLGLEFRLNNEDSAYMLQVEVRVIKNDMKQNIYGLKYIPDPNNQNHQTAINAILAFIARLEE